MVGDVEGKTAIIVDDMISTGGTLVNAVNLVMERGASKVYACAVHGLFAETLWSKSKIARWNRSW